ncbi:MAG: peptidyl-prolyl cis-trans isomerase [Gracilimonas sp.]|uniref:peptidylprolyl isomerase n=1 Tax=Gracilimonas sp. TaxID=1974203 RepID=UPI0019B41374|nr:peptidyl-prolyl cis-trans isomerase [Gracilimonas sp.]MBD3615766.1 peptidyl-prolyl cis-trans isomerase [Gracilimonas sp.]
MKKNIPIFVLAIMLAVSCKPDMNIKDTVLAEVGGQILTKEFAKSEIPPHIFSNDSTLAYSNFRDDWVRRQVILQEANRLNFSNRQDVQDKLQRLEEEFILQAVQDYIITEFENNLDVSEQEARNYYQQNKEKFTLEEQYVRYRHLIASSNADAESAKRELMQGIDWNTVAKKYSKHPDLKIRESERYWPISIAGGDISMLNRYLRIIGPSEISPTHRSGNEYHFVQLLDERPQGDHPDLDWLIVQIKEWLTLEKRKRAFNTYVKNLYLQAQANNEIKIYNVTTETNTAESDTVSLNQITNEE